MVAVAHQLRNTLTTFSSSFIRIESKEARKKVYNWKQQLKQKMKHHCNQRVDETEKNHEKQKNKKI